MSKQDSIKRYNDLNPSYNITNIKKMTKDEYHSRVLQGGQSLDEVYGSYSNAKRQSWNDIMDTYKPQEIKSVIGSSHAYSVMLVAENGDLLWITRDNNYLVVVK